MSSIWKYGLKIGILKSSDKLLIKWIIKYLTLVGI